MSGLAETCEPVWKGVLRVLNSSQNFWIPPMRLQKSGPRLLGGATALVSHMR